MNLLREKIFGFVPCIPISFKTGLSFVPNRLKAARDCQTSTTRQPPGIGPAMCASSPLTGQSASLFLRPFNIILTLFSYLARAVAPRNSKMTPMGMGNLPVLVTVKAYQANTGGYSFTPASRHVQCTSSCPLRANSGHAVLYSITSLARSSMACENLRPSDFAVFRLMTVSKIVGLSMGRSLGFAPRAIRLT